MTYAAETSVSVEKTRAELETTIRNFGADAFGYVTEGSYARIQFRARGKYMRFTLPLPDRNAKTFTHFFYRGNRYDQRQRTTEAAVKGWEQACRSAWRALFLAIKAKLVTVESGISTFEAEFMAFVVLPNGRTAGEEVLPMIEESYRTGQMPAFTLALPEKTT